MHPITIIGTGLAGYTVARELRKLDKDSPLKLITNDDGHFYSKPMLSNAFAKNKDAEALVTTSVTKMAEQLNAEILTHTEVTDINSLNYSKLVLALGAQPIRLAFEGNAADKILSVNDLIDYANFRNVLKDAKTVAIIGAGLIGCEFANDLQQYGNFQVSLIDPISHPLGKLVPPEVGQGLKTALENIGVKFYLEKAVKRIDSGYKLTLTDNTILEADLVLSAIGLRPRIDLAAAANLEVKQGIVVDKYLKTSADNIYALGDCAEVEGMFLPYVMPLMNSARALAKTLAGQTTAVNYPAMPVVVKTPAYPIVVSPPAAGIKGEWKIETDDQNIKALFYTQQQQLMGFVLTGTKVAEKAALTKQLPSIL
jgi:rubredoxin-NAD+ reductase